jgi:uncharacterized protein YcbK (DUF882 family)
MSLQDYIEERGIENFSAVEVCPVGKKARGATLKLAPEELWPNIIHTLRILEWLRDELGQPVHILSGYRDPAYNKAVGGEGNSLHMAFSATDITVKGANPPRVHTVLLTHPEAPQFGLGLYRGFVHLDTRGLIGRKAPARWHG